MAVNLALTGLFLPLASALGFPGATHGPGFVSIPVAVQPRNEGLQRRATAKTADIEMPTFGGNSGWVVNITIGEPGQLTSVSLDTGSTELWVDPECSKAGMATDSGDSSVKVVNDALHDPALCAARGRYEPAKSSSQKQPSNMPGRKFEYGDSTTVYINYYQDKIDFGGITIQDQIFGVANASNQTGIGIMGMGPPPFGFNNSGFYPLILTTMAQQGAINSPAFSLHLRDLGNTTGSLIFGGVDKGKYAGPLTKIPIETVTRKSGDQTFTDHGYFIKVNGMTLLSPNKTQDKKSLSIPGGSFFGGLDCGSGAMLMPKGVASEICKDLNGTVNQNVGGVCFLDCALRQLTGGLTFGLNGKDITVGYENLIMQYGSGDQVTCTLAMQDSPLASYDPPTYLLGAPFLRAVYAVFDWGNEAVHLTQASNCGTNIVAIGTGANAVPGGNGDCGTSFSTNLMVNMKLLIATALVAGLLL